jgi:hypothetical protein
LKRGGFTLLSFGKGSALIRERFLLLFCPIHVQYSYAYEGYPGKI